MALIKVKKQSKEEVKEQKYFTEETCAASISN